MFTFERGRNPKAIALHWFVGPFDERITGSFLSRNPLMFIAKKKPANQRLLANFPEAGTGHILRNKSQQLHVYFWFYGKDDHGRFSL